MPCPYASDFTTAISAACGARARRARTLARRAARSISARARSGAVRLVGAVWLIPPSVSEPHGRIRTAGGRVRHGAGRQGPGTGAGTPGRWAVGHSLEDGVRAAPARAGPA